MAEVQHGLGEKVILGLDQTDGVHSVTFGAFVGIGLGAAAGIATYHGVKELGFPNNDQYEAVTTEIKDAEESAASIYGTVDALEAEGFDEAAAAATARGDEYTAVAEQKTTELPANYSPSVEGAVSGLSAWGVGLIVCFGIARGLSKKARQIRTRDQTTQLDDNPRPFSGSEA